MIVQYKSVIIICLIVIATDATSNQNFSQRCICWLQTKCCSKIRRFFMKIWAFDPKNCQKMLFLALIGQNMYFSWKLGVKPKPLCHSGVSVRIIFSKQKNWNWAHILMRRAQNAAFRQQWTPLTLITLQLAPTAAANRAFETPKSIF